MIINEEKVIKKQLIKNMIDNFLVFTIIFTIFGVVIFNAVRNSIYESSKQELTIASQNLIRIGKEREPKIGNTERNEKLSWNIKMNPRVMYIIRKSDGTIINESNLGRFYEEYGESISFNENILGKIYEMQLNNQYYYRGINLKIIEENEEVTYVQLLINVDSEKAIINNYLQILLVGIGITIMLSIIASYVLSKKALEPIVANWKKQTEFIQNASHELRTPLTIIQAKQELLLQNPESKILDKSEDISLTLKEARRLSKMTKDLMVLARADSEKVVIEKQEIDLNALIKETASPYQEFTQMEKKKLELILTFPDKIKVDPSKIQQLLVILLDNAIKYTKEGDTITIYTEKRENKCVIEVKDTGIGISEEGMKHVFERFYRDDKAHSRKTGGSGLGLSIAVYLVELHKGTIKLAHNSPKGTIVTVKLPKG